MTKKSGKKAAEKNTGGKTPDRDYKVGRGKPPDEHKYKLGCPSPNPAGRPKGSRNHSTLVTEAAFKDLFVTDPRTGTRRRMSKMEIGLAVAANKMAEGDHKALQFFHKELDKIRDDAETHATSIAVSDIDREVIAEIHRRMLLAKLPEDEK